MAVPVCPDCGTTIEPDWDWCHECGFDPEGVRPADWTPRVGALSVFPAADEAPAPATAAASSSATLGDRPPPTLRPHDLLRPRADASGADALVGPLVAPEAEEEHRPLTLDDLRRSAAPASSTAAPATAPPPPASAPPPPAASAAPLAPENDRFSSSIERLRASASPVDERPPLFPTPESFGAVDPDPDPDTAAEPDLGGPATNDLDRVDPDGDDSHPYFDLPYDTPSPAPGSEPAAPEPTSRLRRRKAAADDRPNAASMAMAAGRIPSDAPVDGPVASAASPSTSLPPPPPGAARPAPPPVEVATAPADTSSLGPIVFGPSVGPASSLVPKPPKRKSSPLSVAAILMTIAIAVIVLWPTYQDLTGGESGPAVPPPSAGAIGYAPAGADGARPAVDPQRTASWATSSPTGSGFEVDMPGVVIIRNTTVPLASGSGNAVVASSSTGRGGYAVAAVTSPTDAPWTTTQQASDAILAGFKNQTGNDLKAGAATSLGGVPALALDGTVDGVPSTGAIALVGNRAFLLVAGDASDADLQRFLTSFQSVP